MNESQILEYLTHYQPEMKTRLEQEGILAAYLTEQAAAMQAAKQSLIAKLRASEPQISPFQHEIEAEQHIREQFLPML